VATHGQRLPEVSGWTHWGSTPCWDSNPYLSHLQPDSMTVMPRRPLTYQSRTYFLLILIIGICLNVDLLLKVMTSQYFWTLYYAIQVWYIQLSTSSFSELQSSEDRSQGLGNDNTKRSALTFLEGHCPWISATAH